METTKNSRGSSGSKGSGARQTGRTAAPGSGAASSGGTRQNREPGRSRPDAAKQTPAGKSDPSKKAPQKKAPAKTAPGRSEAARKSSHPSRPAPSSPQKQRPPRPAAYDAADTLTAGKKRTASSRKKKTEFSLQMPWTSREDKKNLSRTEQTRIRQEKRADAAERKRRREQKNPSPVVVYTQPLPFNSSRLLVQLLTVTAVVMALVMGLSVFFKVETIVVHGAEVYSPYAILEASGISEGDNLLTFSRARANGQIQAKLPYVEKSRIGIKLPNTVNIYIEETAVAYAIQTEDSMWWLMNSDGRLVEQIDSGRAAQHTKVLGVTISGPVVNEQAVAAEVPPETDALGEPVPVTITGAQRLSAALQILSALEDNDIVGDAASVDVTTMSAIELWYGTRYQVNLGDSNNMDYKIASMYDVILQLSNYQTGRLDCSFTTWQHEVGYTPFD